MALGFCRLHYDRYRFHGDPLAVQRIPIHAFRPGHRPWNAGSSPTYRCATCGATFQRHGRTRRRIYCSNACQGRAMRGPAHPAWLGDAAITPVNKRLRKSAEAVAWRRAVFVRDDYTCQICGTRGARLNADHVKPWASFPELRFDIDNGRTLCEPCHRKTPTWGQTVQVGS